MDVVFLLLGTACFLVAAIIALVTGGWRGARAGWPLLLRAQLPVVAPGARPALSAAVHRPRGGE